MISSNLNVEFIYCILYGLSELFSNKKQVAKMSMNSIKDNDYTTIHNIKYKKYIENFQSNFNKNSKKNNEQDALIIEYYDTYFKEIRDIDEITNDIVINSFLPYKN